MPIVVNSNVTATTASFNLSRANDALRNSLSRLSSGKRIVNPADDAGGMAVAYKLDSRLSRTQAVRQNNSNALSFLQVQDGALQTIGKIMDRISELRTMANDITKNSSDVENYSKEFVELQSELRQISRAQFNGISLFTTDNAAHKEGFLHRVDNGIEYNGSSYNKFSRIASTHEDGDYDSGHVSINVVNISYLTPFAAAEDISYIFPGSMGVHNAGIPVGSGFEFTSRYNADGSYNSGVITSLGSGFSVGNTFDEGSTGAVSPGPGTQWVVTSVNSSGGITGFAHVSGDLTNGDSWPFPPEDNNDDIMTLSVGTFVDVIERIVDVRAENGAEQNRLNFVDNLLTENQTYLEAAHGRIMNADVALESMRFARQNVLVQSSAAMVAQANQLTSIALSIIG